MDVLLKLFHNKKKHAQITIFIIFALIILVLIIIFFAIRNPPVQQTIDENNPQAYIESCTRDIVEIAINRISKNGGDITPTGYMMYDGEEIVYLCFNGIYYSFCVNQRPLLIKHIEDEITNFTYPKVADCFKTLELKLGRRYQIETGDMELVTRIYPNHVVVKIDKKFKMTRNEITREFNEFKMNMISPIYNFAEIATEIVNQEARYCNFDVLGYMILYPRFDISSTVTGDSDTIYFIKERLTGKQFRFATRSCLLPAGY